MAYVPDDAYDNLDQISLTAFTLYGLICRWRNHTHKNAILNLAAAGRQLGRSQSQIYRLLAELQKANWIVRRGAFITPIFGDFSPCNKTAKVSHTREKVSQICDTVSQICETHHYSNQPLNPALTETAQNSIKKKGQRKTFAECSNRCTDSYYSGKYDTVTTACPNCYTDDNR